MRDQRPPKAGQRQGLLFLLALPPSSACLLVRWWGQGKEKAATKKSTNAVRPAAEARPSLLPCSFSPLRLLFIASFVPSFVALDITRRR